LGIKSYAVTADLQVKVRGSALRTHRYAAPVALSLIAAVLVLTAGATARSYGAPRNISAPRIAGHVASGRTISATHGRWTGAPAW
jgi:hypothetical protein